MCNRSSFVFAVICVLAVLVGPPQVHAVEGVGSAASDSLMTRWIEAFRKTKPQADIRFQASDQPALLKDFLSGKGDFWVSGVPLKTERVTSGQVVAIPLAISGLALIHNLPGGKMPLKLTKSAVSGIYSGRIRTWDHNEILRANPGLKVAKGLPIIPVYRTDEHGSGPIVQQYLSAISENWKKRMAGKKTSEWPVGIGAASASGVVSLVQSNPGAIGFVEIALARLSQLAVAHLEAQSALDFVDPTSEALLGTAEDFTSPQQMGWTVSRRGAYPLTWVINAYVRKTQASGPNSDLSLFLKWVIGPGQAIAREQSLGLLPEKLNRIALSQLNLP